MATPGDEDMFESSGSSLDTTQEEEPQEPVSTYRIVRGKWLNCSKLWLSGDHLYNCERPNKKILLPGGLQPAIHLKCRKYSSGCMGHALVSEMDQLLVKPGYPHTCSGGGIEEAEVLEVGVKMRKAQFENPREDPRKILNQFKVKLPNSTALTVLGGRWNVQACPTFLYPQQAAMDDFLALWRKFPPCHPGY